MKETFKTFFKQGAPNLYRDSIICDQCKNFNYCTTRLEATSAFKTIRKKKIKEKQKIPFSPSKRPLFIFKIK